MPITILDYVRSQVGDKDSYSSDDFFSNGVDMLGGCQGCAATIAAYNAFPSRSGYWRCADCIGDDGFTSVEEFVTFEKDGDRAVGWLLRLRQLQAEGMDFDTALAQANAEADQNDHDATEDDPEASSGYGCPSCKDINKIRELQDHDTFECRDCGTVYSR